MKYFAPISIGNFSVGFDLLGLAVTPIDGELLGDVITISNSKTYELVCTGPYKDVLPADPGANLVTHAYHLFMEEMSKANKATEPLSLLLDKRLPVGSGLGSSASSSVAALYGMNDYFGEPFNMDQLLEMAGSLEGMVSGSTHYDNVAPCLLGGLQLMTPNRQQPSVGVPFPPHWQIVVSYPGVEVATKQAREILPKQLSLEKSITFAQNLSVFIHAMHSEDEELAASVLYDVVAEERRKELIPGFEDYRDFAKSIGALAFGISGSGSTCFAICNDMTVSQRIQNYALKSFCKNSKGFSHICKMDSFGVRPISIEENQQ